jgi:hypothetical protein
MNIRVYSFLDGAIKLLLNFIWVCFNDILAIYSTFLNFNLGTGASFIKKTEKHRQIVSAALLKQG